LEVAWALPCRFAEAQPDGTATIIGGGIDSVFVPETPTDVGVFLMMRIVGPQYEFEEQHTVAVRLIDPAREEAEVLSAGFGPIENPPPLLHPGMDGGLLIPAAIGWQADDFGLYTLEIYIDDHRERSLPILVRDSSELEQQT
jgi:hypothetical protein